MESALISLLSGQRINSRNLESVVTLRAIQPSENGKGGKTLKEQSDMCLEYASALNVFIEVLLIYVCLSF